MKESIITGVLIGIILIGGVFGYTYFVAAHKYTDEMHRFTLALPQGFSAREVETGSDFMQVVVIEDDNGDGLQIVITPFGKEVTELTPESIHTDVPDLQIIDSEVVKIGDTHRGVMFTSNNEAFDGASRELWFVFNGDLYQVATYERLSSLLRGLIAHWQFY